MLVVEMVYKMVATVEWTNRPSVNNAFRSFVFFPPLTLFALKIFHLLKLQSTITESKALGPRQYSETKSNFESKT